MKVSEKNINILIVEDELLIAKNLSNKLENLGYKIAGIVCSGSDAIERAGEMKPDLILMDIVIKGQIDGIETATIINQKLDIPIIYTTAYADEETLERAKNSGSYGYLLKPFKERELHATIKIALSKHQETVKMQQEIASFTAKSEDESRFLAMVYHDLNTPLTTIQLSAEILEDWNYSASIVTANKTVERIKKAAINMSELLEDILMIAKADSGKLFLNLKLVNLVDLCHLILDDMQPIASQQHLINFRHKQDFLYANVDAKLLHHMLINLLSNAIKYSPNGGDVSLEISSKCQQVIFCIRDEGIGMRAEDIGKLFQKFERGGNVSNIKGSGLGLCIVKHIVDLHGGTISVESAIGKGTTFTVALPFDS